MKGSRGGKKEKAAQHFKTTAVTRAYSLVHLVPGAVSEEETNFTSQVFADLKERGQPWDSGSTRGLIF